MSTSRSAVEATKDNSSMDFISQMVGTGLSNSFESLKDKVSTAIKDNGEQYLSDAIDKLKKSATHLVEWSKENPVKTGVAVAAVLAVTAFLVSTANRAKSSAPAKSTKKTVTSPVAKKTRAKSA